jgi:alpha-L-fucosidase
LELKDAAWALSALSSMNRRNLTFLLNAPPNSEGLIDANFRRRLEEIGHAYQRPRDLEEIPGGWLRERPVPAAPLLRRGDGSQG